MADPSTRSGFAAVIGAPNAGKSTLVNQMVGMKVSIVTHKVQTTRFPVRGVAMHDDSQIVFVDTPGIFAPRRRLDRAMVRAAWTGAEEADAIIHVVDAAAQTRIGTPDETGSDHRSGDDVARVIDGLKEAGRTAFLALNKIDAMKREPLLELAQTLNDTGVYSQIFMLSATKGDGVGDLLKAVSETMPEGPYLYPPDQAADLPQSLLAAEITREKLFLRLHAELPYATAVETASWEEKRDGSVRIEQTIFVERESQRAIVLGKQGRAIREIGQRAREELEEILGRRVHLFLHVKVKENWSEQRSLYTPLGLEFDV